MADFFEKIKKKPGDALEHSGRHLKSWTSLFCSAAFLADLDTAIDLKGVPSILRAIGFTAMLVGFMPDYIKKIQEKTFTLKDGISLAVLLVVLLESVLECSVNFIQFFKPAILPCILQSTGLFLPGITLAATVIDLVYSLYAFVDKFIDYTRMSFSDEENKALKRQQLMVDGLYLVLDSIWLAMSILAVVSVAMGPAAPVGLAISLTVLGLVAAVTAVVHTCLRSAVKSKAADYELDQEGPELPNLLAL